MKNTGTKLLHRLPAQDDRESAGLAANLEPDDLRVLGALRPGEAIAFTDEMDRPVRVKIDQDVSAGATPSAERPGSTADLSGTSVNGEFIGDSVRPSAAAMASELADQSTRLCHRDDNLCSLEDLARGERSIAGSLAALWTEFVICSTATGVARSRTPSRALMKVWPLVTPCGWCRIVNEAVASRRGTLRRWSGADPDAFAARLHTFLLTVGGLSSGVVKNPTLFDEPIPSEHQQGVAWGPEPRRAIDLAVSLKVSHPTPEAMASALWGDHVKDSLASYLKGQLPGVFPGGKAAGSPAGVGLPESGAS